MGAQSVVRLSGLELTVRIEYTKTISFGGYTYFIYKLQVLSMNSACPTPTIVLLKQGLYFDCFNVLVLQILIRHQPVGLQQWGKNPNEVMCPICQHCLDHSSLVMLQHWQAGSRVKAKGRTDIK